MCMCMYGNGPGEWKKERKRERERRGQGKGLAYRTHCRLICRLRFFSTRESIQCRNLRRQAGHSLHYRQRRCVGDRDRRRKACRWCLGCRASDRSQDDGAYAGRSRLQLRALRLASGLNFSCGARWGRWLRGCKGLAISTTSEREGSGKLGSGVRGRWVTWSSDITGDWPRKAREFVGKEEGGD